MRNSLFILFILLFLSAAVAYADASQELVPVLSQGETIVQGTFGSLKVQVHILTHELPIGKPSDIRPNTIMSSCTYSKYPCSIVDRIEITVDEISLFIPRSVFCDLSDLVNAKIEGANGGAILTLYGGDASESYIVKIQFGKNGVRRRSFFSAMQPDQLLQETIYYKRILGN